MWFMWFPLFGTWWWLLTLAAFITIIWLEELHEPGGAFLALITYMLIFGFFGTGFSILSWIGDHPMAVGIMAIVYFSAGVPWALFWWKWKQKEHRLKYNEGKRDFLVANNVIDASDVQYATMEIPDTLVEKWNTHTDKHHNFVKNYRTTWMKHRKAITCAMAWWPVHIGSFFLKDFLWDIWGRLLDRFQHWFEKIDGDVWGDASSDFRASKKQDA